MEASNEPADDPFPKTTSKGSFAPTEIKGNDDTLKIGQQGEYFYMRVVEKRPTRKIKYTLGDPVSQRKRMGEPDPHQKELPIASETKSALSKEHRVLISFPSQIQPSQEGVGWQGGDGSLERTGRRSFSQDDIKGIVCSNRDHRQRQTLSK
ncbi:hypothetical protein CEXT_179381 [Caerostris extrusa]|uniref:Uncharacterized protein n=1 Tax=Caerostris extrusa TaxID=172846 RepID=A0AAV4VJ48_CAEEX|nr:hypothetical protein CEXT_179381 [Caerostris extrusa]